MSRVLRAQRYPSLSNLCIADTRGQESWATNAIERKLLRRITSEELNIGMHRHKSDKKVKDIIIT